MHKFNKLTLGYLSVLLLGIKFSTFLEIWDRVLFAFRFVDCRTNNVIYEV